MWPGRLQWPGGHQRVMDPQLHQTPHGEAPVRSPCTQRPQAEAEPAGTETSCPARAGSGLSLGEDVSQGVRLLRGCHRAARLERGPQVPNAPHWNRSSRTPSSLCPAHGKLRSRQGQRVAGVTSGWDGSPWGLGCSLLGLPSGMWALTGSGPPPRVKLMEAGPSGPTEMDEWRRFATLTAGDR